MGSGQCVSLPSTFIFDTGGMVLLSHNPSPHLFFEAGFPSGAQVWMWGCRSGDLRLPREITFSHHHWIPDPGSTTEKTLENIQPSRAEACCGYTSLAHFCLLHPSNPPALSFLEVPDMQFLLWEHCSCWSPPGSQQANVSESLTCSQCTSSICK